MDIEVFNTQMGNTKIELCKISEMVLKEFIHNLDCKHKKELTEEYNKLLDLSIRLQNIHSNINSLVNKE